MYAVKTIAVLLINNHNYTMRYRNYEIGSTSSNAGCLVLSNLWLSKSACDCPRVGILTLLSTWWKQQHMQWSLCKDRQSMQVRQPSFPILAA